MKEEEKSKPDYRRTRDEIAKHVGISPASYDRTKKIILKGDEESKKKLRKGGVGIRKVYSQIRREETQAQLKEARNRMRGYYGKH